MKLYPRLFVVFDIFFYVETVQTADALCKLQNHFLKSVVVCMIKTMCFTLLYTILEFQMVKNIEMSNISIVCQI